MRHSVATALLLALLVVPSRISAQRVQSVADLALRVNRDDLVKVRDQDGALVTGRVTQLTRSSFTIRTDAGERQFAGDKVREVALRGTSARKGALIGAGVFAVLGGVACSQHGTGSCAVMWPVLDAVVFGWPLGATVGGFIPSMGTIYRRPPDGAAVAAPAESAAGHASLLEDLGLVVNLGDALRVHRTTGDAIEGRVTGLTDDELAVTASAVETRIGRGAILRVAKMRDRIRHPGVIGAVVGAATGALSECGGGEDNDCDEGVVMGGLLGAGVGSFVGLFLHTWPVVFAEDAPHVSFRPALSVDAVGFRTSVRW